MRFETVFLTCAAVMASAVMMPVSAAKAGSITGLFNTGVDATAKVLSDGASDTHYTTYYAPAGAATGVRVSPNSLGNKSGMDSTKSQFIGPNNGSNSDGPSGYYAYQTSFTLSGTPSTANIKGIWSSDDVGVSIYVNSTQISLASLPTYTSSTAFTLASGFVVGLNTLTFVFNNSGGGATGLRVQFTSATVPEPASIFLVLSGIVGMGFAGRRAFFSHGSRAAS